MYVPSSPTLKKKKTNVNFSQNTEAPKLSSRQFSTSRRHGGMKLRRDSVPGNEHRACLFNGKFGDAIKLEEGGETY